MREILFKAKRTDNGEWVEGFPFRSILSKELDRMTVYEKLEFATVVNTYEIDPQTVCQYTGLTDKNGAKVFDGDLLKFTDNGNGTEWHGIILFGNPNGEYTWGWQIKHLCGDEANTDTLLWFDMEECLVYSEVTGNIYDNTSTNTSTDGSTDM